MTPLSWKLPGSFQIDSIFGKELESVMMIDGLDWAHLASTDDSTEREPLSDEVFKAMMEHSVRTASTALDQQFDALVAEARRYSDAFWRFTKMKREEGGKENQGYFGTRVRVIKGNTISIEWYLNNFYKDPHDPTATKKKVKSGSLGKGRTFTYPKSTFAKAKDWEREAIEETEKRYADIRKRARMLTKARVALRDFAKACGVSM